MGLVLPVLIIVMGNVFPVFFAVLLLYAIGAQYPNTDLYKFFLNLFLIH